MSLADVPRHPLLFGPSPVHRLDRLTAHLGGAAVWAEREDVNSGIAFGGNRTRKLEYLVADALAQGCDTQEAELGVFFDTVVVCSVTGSTQAGMIAGFARLEEDGGRPRRVLGVDASARPAETREQALRIARRTAQAIGVGRELGLDDVELDERYSAGIYGRPGRGDPRGHAAGCAHGGHGPDPVYEGKSMAATVDLVGRREIDPSATVLYAHLGGQPALNGYSALFS